MKIKKGDMVVLTAGDEKSNTPRKVAEVVKGGERVVLEGVNLVYKHVKKGHPKSPQGGRLRIEKSLSSSNVKFFCSKCNKGVKLGYRYLPDGSKERFCRKCEATVGQIAPARPRYAKSK
jgi:large subunit ribosomal protein L24